MSLLKQKHYATRVFGGCLALALSLSTVGVTAHAEEIPTENTVNAVEDAQTAALEEAQQAVAKAQADAEEQRKAAEEEVARAKAEAEAKAAEIKAEAERKKAEEEARVKAEEEAKRQEELQKAFENSLSASGMSTDDFNSLCKIVQAEAGHEPTDGKIMVANVVLNRVRSPHFANSISAVLASPGQFGPISNGSFASAVPNADTVNAVKSAIAGTDLSNGALYFHRGSSWGNKTLVKTVGSHSFFV